MKASVAREPMTVGQLEARLRKLIPRLGPRDRESILLAIEAIQDLSVRLHKATTGREAVRLGAQCPACLTELVGPVNGVGQVTCPGCGHLWSEVDGQRFLGA